MVLNWEMLFTVDESSEEEDVGSEPKLKYERLSSDLKSILADDSASAIAVHPKFIVLGLILYSLSLTHNDVLHLQFTWYHSSSKVYKMLNNSQF